MAGSTTEVLVSNTTPTPLPASSLYNRRTVEVQNLGPNPIYVAFSSAAAVVTKARRLATNDSWTVSGTGFTLYAIAGTADQVTGAATIVSEVQ